MRDGRVERESGGREGRAREMRRRGMGGEGFGEMRGVGEG